MAATVSEFLPEFDPLTEKQTGLIDEFVAKFLSPEVLPESYQWLLEDAGGASSSASATPLQCDRRRIVAYKLLVARKWDIDNAGEMLKHSTTYREEGNYHRRPFFPSPIIINGYEDEALRNFLKMDVRPTNESLDRIVKRLRPHYSCNFHKWDKSGHPVIIELIGRIKAPEAIKSLKELVRPGQPLSQPVAEMHSFQNELANYLIRYQDAKAESAWRAGGGSGRAPIPAEGPVRRVTSMTAILDATGMNMGMLSNEGIDIIKTTLRLDQANYPELLHRCFIVNCPAIIMFAFNIFKGSLDPRVRSKITFCSVADTPDILKKAIHAADLPKFLGGECECPGGCVCMTACREGESEHDDSSEFFKTEEVSIAAGSKELRELPMTKGTRIAWEWDSASKATIDFSTIFIPDNVEEYKLAVMKEKERLELGGSVRKVPNINNSTPSLSEHNEAATELEQLEPWSVLTPLPPCKHKGNKGGAAPPPSSTHYVSVVPSNRVLCGTGAFKAHDSGTLVLRWSNEFSWMTGKVLRFRVMREYAAGNATTSATTTLTPSL